MSGDVPRTSREMVTMRELTDRHLRAPIMIDNRTSFIVSGSTIKTKRKNGVWDTKEVDLKTLPSAQKLSALVKEFPAEMDRLGECTPRPREEILALAHHEKAILAAEEAERLLSGEKRRGRRRRLDPVASMMTLGDEDEYRARLASAERSSGPTIIYVPVMQEDYGSYVSSEEEEKRKRKAATIDFNIPSGDEEWEDMDVGEEEEDGEDGDDEDSIGNPPLAGDDDDDEQEFGNHALTHRADGTRTAVAHDTKVHAAAKMYAKEVKSAQAGRKRQAISAAPVRAAPSAPEPQLDSAQQYLRDAIKDPNRPSVPPHWREIIAGSPDMMTAVMLLQQTEEFKLLKEAAKMH